ncbi:MAG: ribonuclease HII [bacterium]|nr:ribonuclease HII [bacterium]
MLDLAEEKKLFFRGYKIIGAIDEAGRGPLAGPVVAACVVFNANISIKNQLSEVNDSKKLTALKREKLFGLIKQNFIEVGVGLCDHHTIDKINILQATFLAMKKAIGTLKNKPDFLIIDGSMRLPNCSTPQQAYIKGDERIFSIAAASIIAKVTRDKIMMEMDKMYPNYGFAAHKGYGTKLHLEKLKQFGHCPIHRQSFNRVKGAGLV